MSGWFILLSGWQRNVSLFLAGCVSALAMPPFNLFFLLFVTLPVFVWLMDGVASDPDSGFFSRIANGFKPGFLFGFGYFFAGLWWIGNAFLVDAHGFLWALPIAVIAVPIVLALFWGFTTAVARLFWTDDFRRLFVLAATLGLAEYGRSFIASGFPWNPIAQSAYFSTLTMQSASVFGIYAMTAFVILVFSSPALISPGSEDQKKGKRFVFVVVTLMIVANIGYGALRLNNAEERFVDGVNLRLMQPNIDQSEKFNPEKEAEIIKTYLDVSTSANAQGKEGLSGITHLIWPESAFPFFLTERRDVLASIASMLPQGTSLITGAVRGEASSNTQGGFVFNSIYVINASGEIVSAADKTHLVPFGEYVPLQDIASRLGLRQIVEMDGGFTAGNSRRALSTGTGPEFLPLICYEIIFSGQLLDDGESSRPKWIVNITNDGWFGNTPGPYQHERQSVLRAVEEGMPVVRVSNTGISGVYDPYGRAIARLELGEKGVLDAALPEHVGATIFSKFGGLIFWISLLIFSLIGIIPIKQRPRTSLK